MLAGHVPSPSVNDAKTLTRKVLPLASSFYRPHPWPLALLTHRDSSNTSPAPVPLNSQRPHPGSPSLHHSGGVPFPKPPPPIGHTRRLTPASTLTLSGSPLLRVPPPKLGFPFYPSEGHTPKLSCLGLTEGKGRVAAEA